MKLKYYLRGMGIGIIITTLIFTLAWILFKPNRSDEEIIARAEKLGMVQADGGTIADNMENDPGVTVNPDGSLSVGNPEFNEDATGEGAETETEKPEATAEAEENTEETEDTEKTEETADTKAEADKTAEENTDSKTEESDTEQSSTAQTAGSQSGTSQAGRNQNSTAQSGTAQTGTASVTVTSGDTSAVIAGKLKTAGVIEDADAFDEYLRSRGFDSYIQLGTYEINKGASFNEVAAIITQNKR